MGIFLITERSNNMTCKFKMNSESTAYQKGCRCSLCVNHYEEVVKETRKKRSVRNQSFVRSFKLCCVDCGWNKEPNILQFHHEKNQADNTCLSTLTTTGCTVERLLEEIDKGCFLCPTCHAFRHYNKTTQKVDYRNPELR